MRVQALFGETLRKPPADAGNIAGELLMRAGYVRKVAPASFAFLPPGYRVVEKIAMLICEQLEAMGGQPILLPNLAATDREPGVMPVSEEDAPVMLTALCQSEIHSYRQLPRLLFHFPTWFHPDKSSPGALLRTREDLMQESYSLDRDGEGLREQYERHLALYWRLFERLRLPVNVVEGSRGPFGGAAAHELIYRTPDGGEQAVFCVCGYAAKREIATFKKEVFSAGAPEPLTKTPTPGTSTIDSLSNFLGIDPRQTAKVVFYRGDFGKSGHRLVVCVVRGDMDASDALVQQLCGAIALHPAEPEEIRRVGCEPGFASPIGIDRENALVIADELVTRSPNLVTGANEVDRHYLNSNYERDYTADIVGHIAKAPAEARCADCGEKLTVENCVRVGKLQDMGVYCSEAAGATYLDENGKPRPIFMGRYTLTMTQTLAGLAAEHHDSFGLLLPASIAPYQVALLPLKGAAAEKQGAEIYDKLRNFGISVLLDDRNVSPGVKFNDADLRGIPLRITVSERSLEQGSAEVKLRGEKERTMVPLETLIPTVREMLDRLQS